MKEAWIEETPWSREIHQTRPRAPFAVRYLRCCFGENGIEDREREERKREKKIEGRREGNGKGVRMGKGKDTKLRAKNKISSTGVCPPFQNTLHPFFFPFFFFFFHADTLFSIACHSSRLYFLRNEKFERSFSFVRRIYSIKIYFCKLSS